MLCRPSLRPKARTAARARLYAERRYSLVTAPATIQSITVFRYLYPALVRSSRIVRNILDTLPIPDTSISFTFARQPDAEARIVGGAAPAPRAPQAHAIAIQAHALQPPVHAQILTRPAYCSHSALTRVFPAFHQPWEAR
eukprot:6176806-Pleurochrysis_carterae.AAC.3